MVFREIIDMLMPSLEAICSGGTCFFRKYLISNCSSLVKHLYFCILTPPLSKNFVIKILLWGVGACRGQISRRCSLPDSRLTVMRFASVMISISSISGNLLKKAAMALRRSCVSVTDANLCGFTVCLPPDRFMGLTLSSSDKGRSSASAIYFSNALNVRPTVVWENVERPNFFRVASAAPLWPNPEFEQYRFTA